MPRAPARYSSTTSQVTEAASSGASKVSNAASATTSKASEGLSRVSSSAGPAISGAANSVGRVLGRIGGRTGRVIAFVQSMIPPTIYYSKVGIELAKLVFQGQKMTPPSMATVQSHMQPLLHAMRRPSDLFNNTSSSPLHLNPVHLVNRIRNLSRKEMATAAVVTAELLGFFTVGEVLGRFKLVGYRGEKEGHH